MITQTGMLEWAVKSVTKTGESVSGDRALVREVDSGVLVAAIDGLGHGPAAAIAADQAAKTIEDNDSQDLVTMVQLCHSNQSGKRGVVISMVRLGCDHTLTWLGVGNIAVELLRGKLDSLIRTVERPVLIAGLVGQGQLPTIRTASIPTQINDLLFLATDGIEPGFVETVDIRAGVGDIAGKIITDYNKRTDDALIFVGRYLV